VLRQHNDDFLPDDTTLRIVHVMHFIEDNEFDVSDQIGTTVEHASKNFRCHDQTACLRSDLNVTSQDTDIVELVAEVSELLIAQGLDGRRVDGFRHVFRRKGDGVFSHDQQTYVLPRTQSRRLPDGRQPPSGKCQVQRAILWPSPVRVP
jgi:hypothetical protein